MTGKKESKQSKQSKQVLFTSVNDKVLSLGHVLYYQTPPNHHNISFFQAKNEHTIDFTNHLFALPQLEIYESTMLSSRHLKWSWLSVIQGSGRRDSVYHWWQHQSAISRFAFNNSHMPSWRLSHTSPTFIHATSMMVSQKDIYLTWLNTYVGWIIATMLEP